MPMVTTKGTQSAFCIFRPQSWRGGHFKALGGNRLFSTKGTPLSREPSKSSRPHKKENKYGLKRPSSFDRQPSGRTFPSKLPIPNLKRNSSALASVFLERAEMFERDMRSWTQHGQELEGLGIKSKQEFKEWSRKFKQAVGESCDIYKKYNRDKGSISPTDPRLVMFNALRDAFLEREMRGLTAQIKYSFSKFVMSSQFSPTDVENQTNLADLRFPAEWYPATRALHRHIHLHVGPTNSGKTYQALKRLEEAKTGVYAGPLRLLAHEVYTRLNAKNIPCALVTGEERRVPEGLKDYMLSCTVEMMPLNKPLDVAVIDEIQMIGDSDRGWAWTQAVLGVQAKEVHLCGELRTVELIEKLCTALGDKLTIHRYERLSPLATMNESLKGDLTKLRKGDCLIMFSRVGIHGMKKEIERTTRKRCAVVYGSLPPETRAAQAALFNDPDNDYDFLVASDAVGMGLNLSIKRIIFETTTKFNGYKKAPIELSDIKQIGGRAGRFKTAAQATLSSEDPISNAVDVTDGAEAIEAPKSIGLVTSLIDLDLPSITKAMENDAPPILTAGIFPPASIIQRFAAYFPQRTPFSYILLRLQEISSVRGQFHLCELKDHLQIADVIQPYNLSINDRIIFTACPTNLSDKGATETCAAFAKCIAENRGGELLNIPELNLELLDETTVKDKEYLRQLEALHKGITLYLWLSYRFAGVFPSQELAFHVKGIVEEKIDKCLGEFQGLSKSQKKKLKQQQRLEAEEMELKRMMLEETSDSMVTESDSA